MNTWPHWNKRVVLTMAVLSIMVILIGSTAVQLIKAAEPEPRSDADPRARWREPDSDDLEFFVYLPVVTRNYVPPAASEVTLEPGVGGEIGSPDGKVRIVFDPEAITQTVTVRYQPIEPPALPPHNQGVAGPAFELAAETPAGTPVRHFPYLVTIIPPQQPGYPAIAIVTPTWHIYVHYTPADVAGLDTSQLLLYTRSGPDKDWRWAVSSPDRDRQVIIGEDEWLGQFVPLATTSFPIG